ncbi:MAG: hypothetical protein ACHRHE_03150 [Tepidisphaerales bacterium]
MRTCILVLAGAMLLAGLAGCASDDKTDEDKKRDLSTQQPVPPPLPPSGHTPR